MFVLDIAVDCLAHTLSFFYEGEIEAEPTTKPKSWKKHRICDTFVISCLFPGFCEK